MSKAVLISIQPKWCEKILNGEKTIEIRKTKPNLKPPFKCYIYCTACKRYFSVGGGMAFGDDELYRNEKREIKYGTSIELMACDNYDESYFLNRKVVAEFTCDYITRGYPDLVDVVDQKLSCVPARDIIAYAARKSPYFWHISDLTVYDEPRRLDEFWSIDKCPYATESGCTYSFHCFRAGQKTRCGHRIERAPQSWCYVEETE